MRRLHGPLRTRSIGRGTVLLLVISVLAAGCGSNELSRRSGATSAPVQPPSTSAGASPESFPVTLHAANGTLVIPSRPDRIVSLSPTATETLFAIEAGSQVTAVDSASTYPPEAPVTDLSGLQPNIESIASYDPDLVIASYDPGGLADALAALDITLLIQPAAASMDDVYAQIEELGLATGNGPASDRLTGSMRSEIESLVAGVAAPSDPLSYYHELDDTLYTVTSSTFVGQVYGLLGLRNIADQAKGAGSGYPQLSAEYILKADPDLIFLADTKCCGQSAATLAKRPGWGELTAVQRGSVVELDDDVASRWGPRVVEFVRAVAEAMSSVVATTG